MAAQNGNNHFLAGRQALDDGTGQWGWIRSHRAYCTAIVAIVVVTLFGADWASEPSTEIRTKSSSPSVLLEAPLPAVE